MCSERLKVALTRLGPKVALCAALANAACAAPRAPEPQQSPPKTPEIWWDYDVRIEPNLDLSVEATFIGPVSGGLHAQRETDRFVDGLGLVDESGLHPLKPEDPAWATACRERCVARYRFQTHAAAFFLADPDFALQTERDSIFAPPSSWLVHPANVPTKGRYRFRVTAPSGITFATGVRPTKDERDAYEASIETFAESSFAGIGALRVEPVSAAVELVTAKNLRFEKDVIEKWATSEVEAIADYLGSTPEDRCVVFVLPGTSTVMRGETLGGGGASVLIRLGTEVTTSKLFDDWVLPHELLHVNFPDVGGRHTWFSEGLASYVEPIARARAGLITSERFWKDLVDGLPQGLPAPGDRGLESTDAWGRVYWGGALYFLLADIDIRQQTANGKSLRDAIRGITAQGGNVETYWPISRVIAEGDRATGTRVLSGLYDRFGRAPGTENLDALWARLGVRVDGPTVRFDDAAPLASIRSGITSTEAAKSAAR